MLHTYNKRFRRY